MNKQQLASTIWESANQMRAKSKIDANDYKDFILGFIFYKYLSDKELRFFRENEKLSDEKIKSITEEEVEYANYVRRTLGYFIEYKHLFSTWLEKGSAFDISDVRDALSAFDRNIDDVYKKVFENIFTTLQTGLSKLGINAQAQTKAVRELLKLIKRIPMDGKQDYDVLGFVYEYLISNFAANAGKKAGEFYTPHEVSVLMSEIVAEHLKDRDRIQIYDPTSGSGSLLINIGKAVSKYMNANRIDYYAQELKESTYNLTRMNLVMRDIKPANINVRNGDTLEDDWPFFEEGNKEGTYQLVRVDAVVSNPPYSQKWNPKDKKFDPRYKNYGVAPKGKADYAFLLHDLYHLKDDGIMTIVLPHGVLFRTVGEEGEIRKNLIEKNNIDAIIGLPANIFFGTGIPTIIMVLKRNRITSDVLFIDASRGFEKSGKSNKLRAQDIRKIADTVKYRCSIERYSRTVSKEEIRENDYNLNIPRYIDSSEKVTGHDIYAAMFGGIPKREVDDLNEYWEVFDGLREAIFGKEEKDYLEIVESNLKETIKSSPSVKRYRDRFMEMVDNLYVYLKDELIEGILDINIEETKERISQEIFRRIGQIELVDPYNAYGVFAKQWDIIETDLEMILTEGFSAINQVDPNMVLKKNTDTEDEIPEVQEGWKGRILPFDLVQSFCLSGDLDEIRIMEERLNEISTCYQEIIDSLEEDEKDSALLNDDKFVATEVRAYVKEILDEVENEEIIALREYSELSRKKEKLEFIESHSQVVWEKLEKAKDGTYKKSSVKNRIIDIQKQHKFEGGSFEEKIVKVVNLLDEESDLKRILKSKNEALHMKTKETIENLPEEDTLDLLEQKWIQPLLEGMRNLCREVLKDLENKVLSLEEKYATTLIDIESGIREESKGFSKMTRNLKGSDEDLQGLNELLGILGV